jgi:hypothetical protein
LEICHSVHGTPPIRLGGGQGYITPKKRKIVITKKQTIDRKTAKIDNGIIAIKREIKAPNKKRKKTSKNPQIFITLPPLIVNL